MAFAPLSLFSTLANHEADDWVDEAGDGTYYGLVAYAATALVIFGYALCCGLLDKMIVGPEFGHRKESFGKAVRTLPYWRLICLDVVTAAGIAVVLALGVLPGLVLFTFIALAPPLMVSEHRGVWSSVKRSAVLVRRAFWVTFVVVTLPVLVEHEIFALVELLFDFPLVVLWLAHLAASVFVLAVVVLCEVTLAFTLVEREHDIERPGQPVVVGATDGLVSDA